MWGQREQFSGNPKRSKRHAGGWWSGVGGGLSGDYCTGENFISPPLESPKLPTASRTPSHAKPMLRSDSTPQRLLNGAKGHGNPNQCGVFEEGAKKRCKNAATPDVGVPRECSAGGISTALTHTPKFRQGKISPPSLKTKFSDAIIPAQNYPLPPACGVCLAM